MSDAGLAARVAGRLAAVDRLPTAHRAVLGYYAETGTFDADALGLKSRVDDVMDAVLADLYADCEDALVAAFDVDDATFSYETKLTLPAELTLGYLFRRARDRATGGYDPVAAADGTDGDEPEGVRAALGAAVAGLPRPGGRPDGAVARRPANREAAADAREAREMTAFVVGALLDGDMRDAINDDEFEDFVVEFDPARPDADPRRVARVVQSRLQSRVEAGFDRYPAGVREAYDHAVEVSEAHQAQDDRFRALMTAADDDGGDGPAGDASGSGEESPTGDGGRRADAAALSPAAARDAIDDEYRHRPMSDESHPFTASELDLPYLTTQYDRVGVIYHGMLEMYRAAGFEVEPAFERSIVFAIVGAQVWLDDVDDYRDDVAEGQLTPVTAEYLLAPDDTTAFERVRGVSETYFDRAREYAAAADSTLTGIAVEYILRSGDVSHLPGAPE
jgi:hypothetical protein